MGFTAWIKDAISEGKILTNPFHLLRIFFLCFKSDFELYEESAAKRKTVALMQDKDAGFATKKSAWLKSLD